MVQLVAQPTALWDKFLRLLTGDYHVPKINKEGKTHLVKGPPIKTTSFLFNLFLSNYVIQRPNQNLYNAYGHVEKH